MIAPFMKRSCLIKKKNGIAAKAFAILPAPAIPVLFGCALVRHPAPYCAGCAGAAGAAGAGAAGAGCVVPELSDVVAGFTVSDVFSDLPLIITQPTSAMITIAPRMAHIVPFFSITRHLLLADPDSNLRPKKCWKIDVLRLKSGS
jgi:hypothetical protein